MAVASTSQILHDGPRRLVMQFTGIGDGNGDETNVAKVHMADLERTPLSVKISQITYDVSGGIVQLSWDAVPPVPFINLLSVNEICYDSSGGMTNGGGDTATGDILLSTLGFEAGSSYSVTIEMLKKFP